MITNSFITSSRDEIGNRKKLEIEVKKIGPNLPFRTSHVIENIGADINIQIANQDVETGIENNKEYTSDEKHNVDGEGTQDCLGRDDFNPVIGGVSFGGYLKGEKSVGTSGVRVHINSGNDEGKYMMTNAHNFQLLDRSDRYAYQYESSPSWGTTTDIWKDNNGLDYILVEKTKYRRDMSGSVLHKKDTKINIQGRVATNELVIGNTIYKTGKTSGADKGEIVGVNNVEVEHNAESAPGDSGGPIYLKDYSPYIGEHWALTGIHYGHRGDIYDYKVECDGVEYTVHTDGVGSSAEAIVNDIKDQADGDPIVSFG